MYRRILQILALAVCLGLLPIAYAKSGGPPVSKGKAASTRSSQVMHHEYNGRDPYAVRRNERERRATASTGPSSRPSGWNQGKKTGWGDCNVPPGQARKRGCDASGFSARERATRRRSDVINRPATATTSRTARPGETRGIILQRNAATTSKAARPGETRGIILQRNAATTSKAARPGQTQAIILQRNAATKGALQK